MPLKRCTNSEGKRGWSWGNGGCQVAGSDEESKKQAIRVGLKVDGPHKFTEIMKKEHSSVKNIARAVLLEESIDNICKGYISQEERDKVPDEDFAGLHKSFPIRNAEDVKHAAHLIGHGENPEQIKENIKRIAKRKNLPLPESWK